VIATADKRRLLLDAAVRVFAKKGYHACRVGDIAKEAGVAYGLLYHYFSSKEEVLETIFRETWTAMLEAVSAVEEADDPAWVKVRKVSAIVLRTWEANPDLIRVVIREITRSPHVQLEVEEISHAFDALERIVRDGQESGEFRPGVPPRVAALVLYGGLEQLLTSWVMGAPPASEEEIRSAERAVTHMLCDGLLAAGEPTVPLSRQHD
jgi:AcrR family transcriptional regulator